MTDTFDKILAAFGASQVNINDLPKEDPRHARGRMCEALFTDGVDALRSIFPNARVQALARAIWDLVGHKHVLVAIGPDIPSLSFTIMQLEGVHQGVVLIPKGWPEMVKANTFMQLGAILFVGAQVVDFYNGRLIGDAGAPARWDAYEAEFLRALKQQLPDWKMTAHQRAVMAKYPDGLDTLDVELYAFKSCPSGTA